MCKNERSRKLLALFIELQAQADRFHMSDVTLDEFIEREGETRANKRIMEMFDSLQLESELV